jgi:type IV pilus assembly protein PilN
MIRINLLGVDRKARKAPAFDLSRQLTLACSLILVVAALGIGWWYWTLDQDAAQVEAEIQAAQNERTRLQSLLTEVKEFETRRGQLQQRVQLIEQLRAGQSIPVQLLDHVSRSVPDMLWLIEMEQTAEALTIQGQSTTLIALSDFVGNLASSDLLVRPIQIVNSQVESAQAGGQGRASVEVIQFTVRAGIKQPVAPPQPVAPRGRGAARGAARGAGG